MILIPCPHCGPRNSSEFHYVGERNSRPDPNATGQVEWRAYLYDKRNPSSWTSEKWFHSLGCRRFLYIERHTVTNEVRACAPAAPPEAYR